MTAFEWKGRCGMPNSVKTLKRYRTFCVQEQHRYSSTNSKGDQGKWRIGDVWIKADTQGYEGLAEELGTLLLTCVEDVPHVSYAVCTLKIGDVVRHGCYSHSMFLHGDEAFVSLSRLFEQRGLLFEDLLQGRSAQEGIASVLSFLESNYGLHLEDYLCKTLYVDLLMANEDRHPNNLGVIRDMKANQFRMAPIFDNGLAFLARNTLWGKLPVEVALRRLKYEPFGNRQVQALRKLFPDYKLRINKDLLDKRLSEYTNSLYSEQTVARAIAVLNHQLDAYEGSVWTRR